MLVCMWCMYLCACMHGSGFYIWMYRRYNMYSTPGSRVRIWDIICLSAGDSVCHPSVVWVTMWLVVVVELCLEKRVFYRMISGFHTSINVDVTANWLKPGTLQVKASSYIAQYPVLGTVQNALHFTSLTDLFTQTPSRLLWEASSHMLQLMHEGCSYTYPPLSIARYSFIQLSELEQCRVKKLAQGFNTAARIRTRVFLVRSPEVYPWATALYKLCTV